VHLATLGAFVVVETVLCIIPGPAVMAVVGASLSRERAGYAAASGVVTGNLAYFAISAAGIASVIVQSHTAFQIVRWCGAAYLAYLGIRSLLVREAGLYPDGRDDDSFKMARGWASGALTQLANPKALVFFAAILPQFIDPRESLLTQIVILGIASQCIEFAVLSGYIVAANRIRERGIAVKSRTLAERVGGLFLLGVAAAVVRESP
jgi:homoserine/homoserine lactone efflux protein